MKKRTSIISGLISAAFLATLAGGCGGENPESMLASGKSFLTKNDNKAAIIQLKNALQINPNLGEGRFLLGKALLENGDFAGAEVELLKALDLKYSADQTIPLLAQALLATGQAKKITDDFANVILPAGEPQASLKTTLSAAYAAQGNREAAQKELTAALAAKWDYQPAQLTDARYKAASRDFDAAQSIVDSVLTKNPRNHDALLLSGSLQAVKNNQDGAIALYLKAIEAKPDFLAAYFSVISTFFQQQKLDEASKQIEALKKIYPKHPMTLYLDAQSSYQRKDFKSARELMQQLLKISPNNANALQLAGATEYQLRADIQADAYLNKALQINPDLQLSRKLLASSNLRAGQSAKALIILQPVLDRTDNDASLLALAGEAYLMNGDANKAAHYFAKASRLDPNDASKKTSLALAHLAQGNSAGAFEELEQISLADKGPTADLALITAYLQSNQFDRALKAIDGLEKKQPNNPATYNLRARTLLAKKDVPGARRSFEKALSVNPSFFPAAATLAALDIADNKKGDAKKRFEAVLAADPKNAQAMLALAELHASDGGALEETVAQIVKAVAVNPLDVAPRLALIQLYLKNKNTKKALAAANEAAAAIPDKPEILDALGRTQQILGDLNQALNTYTKLATVQPLSPLAQLRMADIHLAAKNKDEAIKSLKRALEIKPDLIEAQRGLIQLSMEAKMPAEALNLARQIQKQHPKDPIGYGLEGDIHASAKAWPESINAYRNGLKQLASPDLAIKLNVALLASGNSAEADRLAIAWMKEHPNDISFRVHLGDLAVTRGEYPLAAQQYRIALDSQPNNSLILNNLAWVSGQLKSPKAIDYAERAVELSPNQPAFIDTLAMLLADKGETAKAIDLLRKALTISPESGAIQLNLAKVLISDGKKDEARKILDGIAKQGDAFPGQPEVLRLKNTL